MSLSVLYLSVLAGSWWPGVSRQCATCRGRLLLGDAGVACLACGRVAYRVQDQRRPSLRENSLAAPPPKRGRPPGTRHRRPPTHCGHGHPWTDANTGRDRNGYRVCRVCKRESGRRRKMAS